MCCECDWMRVLGRSQALSSDICGGGDPFSRNTKSPIVEAAHVVVFVIRAAKERVVFFSCVHIHRYRCLSVSATVYVSLSLCAAGYVLEYA